MSLVEKKFCAFYGRNSQDHVLSLSTEFENSPIEFNIKCMTKYGLFLKALVIMTLKDEQRILQNAFCLMKIPTNWCQSHSFYNSLQEQGICF